MKCNFVNGFVSRITDDLLRSILVAMGSEVEARLLSKPTFKIVRKISHSKHMQRSPEVTEEWPPWSMIHEHHLCLKN